MSMGMAYGAPIDLRPRRSTVYPSCFYCPRCEATYTPNQEWGTVVSRPPRCDTSGVGPTLAGVRRLGDECPFCHQEPAHASEATT